jgi:hypothetical protein
MLFGQDLGADTKAVAASVRKEIAAQLHIPEGALAAMAKTRPGIASTLYQACWKHMWPGVRAHLLSLYAPTTFNNYTQERMFIEGYDKGSYSES